MSSTTTATAAKVLVLLHGELQMRVQVIPYSPVHLYHAIARTRMERWMSLSGVTCIWSFSSVTLPITMNNWWEGKEEQEQDGVWCQALWSISRAQTSTPFCLALHKAASFSLVFTECENIPLIMMTYRLQKLFISTSNKDTGVLVRWFSEGGWLHSSLRMRLIPRTHILEGENQLV